MKTLILIRHAKSSWDYPSLPDHARPLNKRGERDVPRMGKYLYNKDLKPDVLISSTAKRAKRTALGIAKEIEFPKSEILEESALYHASSHTLLTVVQNLLTANCVILFGHNPGFTDFANQLAGLNIENVPTCGVVGIDFDINDWNEVAFGAGDLSYFYYPKGI